MRRPAIAVRIGLAVLAALNLGWGVWARVWPRHFFEEFPGWGHRWTAAYPPFNEHLMTDLGSTFLPLGFLLAIAAVLDDRRLRVVVLSGVLLFNTLHVAFHLADRGALGGLDAGASLAALIVGVFAPLALLVISAAAGADQRQEAARGRPNHGR